MNKDPLFPSDEVVVDKDLVLAETEAEQELPQEIIEKRKKGLLKTGYTTGTSATAATKAALFTLIYSEEVFETDVILPKGRIVKLKIAWTRIDKTKRSVTCAVIKDGGDDPDVTHGTEICSTVSFNSYKGEISINGGEGVGRVTRPGLGLEIGSAAINPVPKKMLENAIKEVGVKILEEKGITVIISVPKGAEIAKKTDNPRLGIIGGISILGTTGIVFPYSTASFAASIRQSLDVAITLGTLTVVLTTGGRSEDFAKSLFQDIPDYAFVQMGDFSGYTIKQCTKRSIKKVIIAGFIGKLTKIAMGIKQTHVRGSHVSLDFMARIASTCTRSEKIINEIKNANTARHVSEIIMKNNIPRFFDVICENVFKQMFSHADKQLEITVIMFDFDGCVCGSYPPSIFFPKIIK
ncbi:MAG TPA: cobalt-precorrin-5B (C(1))-methyltransferase [Nitrososphaeraceae archaeon]|nr:cobalt-precorrin-5B (C(1))-methyltransferase [Nitrososphaeraceae archaeon]